MANKKQTPAKRKYTKRSNRWSVKADQPDADQKEEENQKDNPDLVSTIIHALDRLNTRDKAKVLSYILGHTELDSRQVWAIEKIIST